MVYSNSRCFVFAVATLAFIASAPLDAQVTASPASLDLQWARQTPPLTPVEITISGGTITSASLLGTGASAFQFSITGPNTISVALGAVPATGNVFSATLRIVTSAGNIDIPLTLTIGSSASTSVTPNPLALTAPFGGGAVSGTLSVSSGTPVAVSVSSVTTQTGAGWLTAVANGSTTPTTITVTANPFGLPVGTYSGTVTVSVGGQQIPVSVQFGVGTGGVTGLTLSQNPISLTYAPGGTVPSQVVSVTSTNATTITATQGVSWITIDGQAIVSKSVTAGGAALFTISINPLAVPSGNVGTGTVSFTGLDGSSTTLTVNLNSTGFLSISPQTLNFSYPFGATAQGVVVSTGTAGSTTVSATSNQTWLSVSPSFDAITAGSSRTFTVSVAPAGLATGTYFGTITFQAAGAVNETRAVSVTLTVSTGSGGTGGLVNPSSLTFTHQAGSSLTPVEQALYIQGIAGGTYTATFTPGTGGNFVVLATSGGTLPGVLLVRANPIGLSAGTYQGTISINSSSGFFNIPVTLSVASSAVLRANPGAFVVEATGSAVTRFLDITSSSSPTELSFSISASANWITVTPNSGTTPRNVQVTINPVGLGAGTYTGNIVITGGASTLTVPVVLIVGGGGAGGFATPTSLSFSGVAGGVSGSPQTVALNLGSTTTFSVLPNVNWISVTPTSGVINAGIPTNLAVNVNPALLIAGTHTGTFTITTGTGLQQTVTVTASITGITGVFTASPSTVTFNYQQGEAAPAAQNVNITSNPSGLAMTAAVTSSTPWLQASLSSNVTPATLTLTVNPTGLPTGSHTGTVTITPAAGGTPVTVNVQLTVAPGGDLSISPADLSFTFRTSGAPPAAQNLQVSSTGAPMGFSASTNASWIRLSPASGTTPGVIQVSVDPSGLNAGVHSGVITVTSTSGSTQRTRTVNVTLRVEAPLPTIERVVNAASYTDAMLAPGEIVVVQGSGQGPDQLVTATVTNNAFPTIVADTRVLFNGVPGRLLYTRADQVAAIVPFSAAGSTTMNVQVEYRGQRSNVITLPLVQAAPGVFTLNASGSGPGAILNQDFSVNGPGNGAARGEVVAIYATGGGQTFPLSLDGELAPGANRTILNVEAEIGGVPAEVLYGGTATGLVSSLLQANVRVPANLQPGTHTVILRVNGVPSQTGVTMLVR